MEKHRCKFCLRNFANGRALGGHMRSHVMMAMAAAKPEFLDDDDEEIESVPSSTSSDDDDEEEEEDKGLSSYGMGTNPRNFKRRSGSGDGGSGGGAWMVDSHSDQFCSVVLQDRESETESSRNPIRRRSRRVRKSDFSGIKKNKKQGMINPPESAPVSAEAEPVSSISDTTPEQDLANCLMMLSRDKWLIENTTEEEKEEEEDQEADFFDAEEEEEEEEDGSKKRKYYSHDDFDVVKISKGTSRGKYRCDSCNKVFRSYQALGGHRASHKRIKLHTDEKQKGNDVSGKVVEVVKIHECPVCFKVFSSGQALGGHKRSHVMGAHAAAAANTTAIPIPIPPSKPFPRFGETNFIDLNLPAPVDDDDDDDDDSQIELSAVSDADFVNTVKK